MSLNCKSNLQNFCVSRYNRAQYLQKWPLLSADQPEKILTYVHTLLHSLPNKGSKQRMNFLISYRPILHTFSQPQKLMVQTPHYKKNFAETVSYFQLVYIPLGQEFYDCSTTHRISSNKRLASNKRCPLISASPFGIHIEISASNKRRTSKCGAYWNSYYLLLVAKPKCIWNQYANNKTMKILLRFRFLHNIWLYFINISKRKNDKVLIFNIVISLTLK